MSKPTERNLGPVTVPFAATPTGEPLSIVDWANRSVWTDRMLTTLEQGVRGGRWHTLIDKVYAPLNLFVASSHVLDKNGAAGVDRQKVDAFQRNRQQELDRLHEQLKAGTYRPQAVRRVWIEKPGSKEQRPLGVPTVRDRVIQTAILHVLEPIFDALLFLAIQLRVPARTRVSTTSSDESKNYSKLDTSTWSMPTSRAILTRSQSRD